MSWNPVLNKFVEVKNAFVAKYGKGILWNYDEKKECCLEYWARLLKDEELQKMFSFLHFSEKNGLLLVRYTEWWDRGDETPFWDRYDGFYRECRSVTIDVRNDALVHVPFRKFLNLNETEEYSKEHIEERIRKAKTVEFSNKLDGSMTSARYYNGRMVLASSQSVNTESSWRLKDMCRMFREKEGYAQLAKDYPQKTFIYEYLSKKDAHVVNYTKEQEGLYLIGVRDVVTGEEASYREVLLFAEKYNIPTTVMYETSLDKVLSSLGDKKSNEAEGFVINIDGFKVKIKYDDYVMMHTILSKTASPNTVIRAIADGNFDDFISKVPESYKERVLETADKVFTYLRIMNEAISITYEAAPKDHKTRYAVWVQENTPKCLRGYLMMEYNGKDYNLIRKHEPPHAHYPSMEDIERNTTIVERFLAEKNWEREER